MLPQDPIILLSYINMQFRDKYASLEDLIEGLDISKEEFDKAKKSLEDMGYFYDEATNQFK